jgi:uncharacterized MnhB-related membrane protein
MVAMVIVVSVLLIGLAAGAVFVRSLGSAVILLGTVSLLVSATFLLLAAPDVAITEAAIGSALTTLVYVLVLKRTNSVDSLEDGSNLQTGKHSEPASNGGSPTGGSHA